MNAPGPGRPAGISLKTRSSSARSATSTGEWVANGRTLTVVNPATARCSPPVPKLGAEETRRAIDAAERAWPAWRAKTARSAAILRGSSS